LCPKKTGKNVKSKGGIGFADTTICRVGKKAGEKERRDSFILWFNCAFCEKVRKREKEVKCDFYCQLKFPQEETKKGGAT